jgi:hypothetical protein
MLEFSLNKRRSPRTLVVIHMQATLRAPPENILRRGCPLIANEKLNLTLA